MNSGTIKTLDHIINRTIGSLFFGGKNFVFQKTLLDTVYVYVGKYSTVTVGIETMGHQDHRNLKPWKSGTSEP